MKYKIITSLSSATEDNVIYLYSVNPNSVNNKYNEYMRINNSLELIGSTDVDLSNYITIDDPIITNLNTTVGSLSTTVNNLNTDVSNLSTTVSNLNTRVTNLETTVGNLSANLDNYVLTTTFNSVVGDLSDVNGVYNDLYSDGSISDNLVDIYDRLTWKELNE